MYKRLPLILLHFFVLIQANSQTFDEICLQAKNDNKVIMLIVESKECFYCNEINRLGVTAPSFEKKLKNDAILYFVSKVPEEINKPEYIYSITDKFYGSIFLDGDKNILQTYAGATSSYFFHEYQLKLANQEKKRRKNDFTELSMNFFTGKKTFCDTYSLIEKIVFKGLEPKQYLVDTLVQLAPTDSSRSLHFLQFLYKTAPEVGSVTERYLFQNPDNYQSAWWRMSADTRSRLNSRMLVKSLKKAVIDNDRKYIMDVANSAAYRSGESGTQASQNGRISMLLQFFKEIKDTLSFMTYAVPFIDRYFSVNIDSIFKIDSTYKVQIKRETEQNKRLYDAQIRAFFKVTDYQSQAMRYAIIFNNAASTILSFSKNQKYLQDAVRWAKKANELFPSPDFMDTYARLLYKTNQKELAIEWETKAIDLMKSKEKNTQLMEMMLEKMKNGNEEIDKQ